MKNWTCALKTVVLWTVVLGSGVNDFMKQWLRFYENLKLDVGAFRAFKICLNDFKVTIEFKTLGFKSSLL